MALLRLFFPQYMLLILFKVASSGDNTKNNTRNWCELIFEQSSFWAELWRVSFPIMCILLLKCHSRPSPLLLTYSELHASKFTMSPTELDLRGKTWVSVYKIFVGSLTPHLGDACVLGMYGPQTGEQGDFKQNLLCMLLQHNFFQDSSRNASICSTERNTLPAHRIQPGFALCQNHSSLL